MPLKNVSAVLTKALVVAVTGGIAAFLLSLTLLPLLQVLPFANIVTSVVLIVALVYFGAQAKIDDQSFVEILVFLIALGTVGSLLTSFVPQLSQFILSIGSFTIMGLGWTILYIEIAEVVIKKVGL